jgi:hypothetical protein
VSVAVAGSPPAQNPWPVSACTRVVLLGASNLATGLPTALRTARAALGPGPMEVLVAAGHGRSYGRWSRVGVRGLPGILECGLWPALSRSAVSRTHAVVTDIGNDLAYGASPADVAGWVSGCVERLATAGADIVLTLLPAHSLARLTPWQYHLVKAIMFPGRRLPFPALHDRVREVNERLSRLASALAVPTVKLVEPSAHWYGADRIHVRRSRQSLVWSEILSRWETAPDRGTVPGQLLTLACRYRIAPERRTVLGVTLRRRQPSAVLADGTPVSLY